ncbi:MAG: phage tail protein [Alphaproteobacteria bacterium]|nr:phage tail protein [Alphaproteobacteria bacterium]MCB9791541.1 phage tail protein [Alphaproteobacteria bacterium]
MASAERNHPYGAFNFQVNLGDGEDVNSVKAGFSDVSGLGTEFLVAEYRNGNDPFNHVQKVAGLYKVSDVTLKRGIIDSKSLFDWIKEVRTSGSSAKRSVTITLLDESRNPVQTWTLHGVIPMKFTGPTLAAKAHGDVAMEELTLSCEDVTVESVG